MGAAEANDVGSGTKVVVASSRNGQGSDQLLVALRPVLSVRVIPYLGADHLNLLYLEEAVT